MRRYIRHLLSEATFDLTKSTPASFDPDSRVLQQELYLVNINSEAEWSLSVADQLEFGKLLELVPPTR